MENCELTGPPAEMFGPLNFAEAALDSDNSPCLLCEDTFNLVIGFEIFVKHLFEVHNVVVEDVQNIHNLPEYVQFWRSKFKDFPIEEIIPSIKIEGTGRNYYLLSTLLKEDKELRHKLKLEAAIKVYEFERTDDKYCRECLFCRTNFEGKRHDFLEHLSSRHNLYLGDPNNLVYIEELVEKIDKKLMDLKCLYCDKTFPERTVLKEHMRKKLHKRLNEDMSQYDKYFIINYLEVDKTWKDLLKNKRESLTNPTDADWNADEEYRDWNETDGPITCLFCDKRETDINVLCLHMDADHDFDFAETTKDFDFYKKVKLVNYIRRQVHNKKCAFCHVTCETSATLQQHLFEEKHCRAPDVKFFDQPEYYFPTYENDYFLYLIDDVVDDDENTSNSQ